jgi:hypothetical protein
MEFQSCASQCVRLRSLNNESKEAEHVCSLLHRFGASPRLIFRIHHRRRVIRHPPASPPGWPAAAPALEKKPSTWRQGTKKGTNGQHPPSYSVLLPQSLHLLHARDSARAWPILIWCLRACCLWFQLSPRRPLPMEWSKQKPAPWLTYRPGHLPSPIAYLLKGSKHKLWRERTGRASRARAACESIVYESNQACPII